MEKNGVGSRLKHAWNAFLNKDPTAGGYHNNVQSYIRPDMPRFTRGNERTICTAVYNRIALDVASMTFRHCYVDEDGKYVSTIQSNLNECLTIEANIDQTTSAFIQDAVITLLDKGVCAIVPVETTLNPKITGSYDVNNMRVGEIIEWAPKDVKVKLYNENTGKKEEIWLPKSMTCVVPNPMYSVMNEPNSTLQRLIRKLCILDVIDEQSGSGKLDLIVQLPYTVRNETKRAQAREHKEDLEYQLANSRFGIAYTDSVEKITQLNRPVENNLMKQVEYLMDTFYSQLGMTQEVLNGTADDKTMLNYYNRTVEPIVRAIVDNMKRTFLTKTARTRGQSIVAFRDPFKLVPINDIAEIADKFTRNEILSSNEIRQIIGIKPSNDPKADELVNSNISQPNDEAQQEAEGHEEYEEYPEE